MSLDIQVGANVSEASQKLTKFYADLKKSINEVNTTVQKSSDTFQKSTEKMTESVKSFGKASQNSLTALSLTLQDLPFGFIGIQNNLPGIIQGFGQMSAEAKTGASVMSQLKGALIGPAGIFLAFSAVTAAVTALTMKYGSLGAAIDALFTKQTKFNEVIVRAGESLKEYNKSLITNNELIGQAGASQAGQALSARALLATVLDLTKTEAERKKALDGLKKLDEERFKNFDIEKGKLDGLKQAVEGYTRALIAQSVASKFVDQVSNTSVELEKQRNALGELFKQLNDLQKKYPNLSAEAKKYSDELISSQGRLGAGLVQPGKGVLDYIATFKKISEQEGVIQGVVKQLEDLNKATITAVKSASQLASPFKQVEEKVKKPKKELDLEELSRKARYAANKLQDQADRNRLKYLEEQLKLEEKITKETFAQADKDMKADAEAFSKENFKKLSEFTKPLDELQKSFEATKIFLQDIFFNPLQDLFQNFLDTGKFTFKEFGKVVLDNLKRIVAQIAAQQVIQILAQVLNPMGALASTGVLTNPAANAGKGQKGILSALSNIFLGRVANPNFGGVDGGQMGMSGSVNLVLRGTDLVGSINRTNAQISRVG